MIISKISNENFMGGNLKMKWRFYHEKEGKYCDLDSDNIKSVDFQKRNKTAIISLNSGVYRYLDLDESGKKGYRTHDILAAINTAKNGVNVIM